MKDEITKINLFCINCNAETPHTVQYIGSYLRSVSCDGCTKKIEIDRRHLRTVFAEDFIDRILTKPHRMNEDMKKAFATLTPFFPKRLITEPLQVLRDIYEVLRKDTGRDDLNKKEAINKEVINKEKTGKNVSNKIVGSKSAGSGTDIEKKLDKKIKDKK